MRQPNAPHSRHAASIRPSCSDKKVEAEWTPQMEGEATHYYLTNYIGKCPGLRTAMEVAVLQGSQAAIWPCMIPAGSPCNDGLLPNAAAVNASSHMPELVAASDLLRAVIANLCLQMLSRRRTWM